MGRDKRKKVPKHSRGGQELDEDDLAVARPVEIGEEGLLDIAAGTVEGPRWYVLGAGGGVRIDAP